MSVNVTFRVVGLYCYIPNQDLTTVDPSSTVESVMDAVAAQNPNFSYESMMLPANQKKLVDKISYTFDENSEQPPNSGVPKPGFRSEEIVLGPISLVWQYYRTVTVDLGGNIFEIKTNTPGQRSYADVALNEDVAVPDGANILSYNLTWRLVKIEMSPENMKNYMEAKAKNLA